MWKGGNLIPDQYSCTETPFELVGSVLIWLNETAVSFLAFVSPYCQNNILQKHSTVSSEAQLFSDRKEPYCLGTDVFELCNQRTVPWCQCKCLGFCPKWQPIHYSKGNRVPFGTQSRSRCGLGAPVKVSGVRFWKRNRNYSMGGISQGNKGNRYMFRNQPWHRQHSKGAKLYTGGM